MSVQDQFPDPARAALGDVQTRNLYFSANLHLDIELTDPYTTTLVTDQPQRIRSVQVAEASGGTVTVQIQIDGRDVFADDSRPVSGGQVAYPTEIYSFGAGSDLTAIGEAFSPVEPTGTVGVEIEVEPFILASPSPQIEPRGADRKRPSSRARIKEFNATGSLVPAIVTQRIVGNPQPLVLPIGEPLGYRPR